MTLADYFQSERELTQRFIDIQRAGLERSMMLRLISGEEWPELEELKDELAAAGVAVPVWEEGIAGYQQVAAVMNTVLNMEVILTPAVPVEALFAAGGPPVVTCGNARGIPEVAWLADLAEGRTWVKLDIAARHLKIETEGLRDLPALFSAVAAAIAEALRNPRTMGLEKRIWNPAREFNPECVTSLRISGFKWHVDSPNKIVVLQLEEAGKGLVQAEARVREQPACLPAHPTLAAPWRLMEIRKEDGKLWEQQIAATPEGAWEAHVESILDIAATIQGPRREGSWDELVACHERRGVGGVIVLPANLNRGREERFRIEQDDKDLRVIGRYQRATCAGRVGAKAREIWFRRFEGVIADALPEPLRALRYVLKQRAPKSPLRTFVAGLVADSGLELPACPECGEPCSRIVHLDVRHHPQRPVLPGTSLLMFTCVEHNLFAEWWQHRWLAAGEAATLIPDLLEEADQVWSGPAYHELDYETEKVDEELLNREDERWPAYEDSWEKKYFMFACPGTKLGGWPSWIQGDCTPEDTEGKPMQFVGQLSCYELIEIGDSGEAYVFYSAGTGETKVLTQCY